VVLRAFLFVAVPVVENDEGVAPELLACRREGHLVVLAFEQLLAELRLEALDGSAQCGGTDMAGARSPPEVERARELDELVQRLILDHRSPLTLRNPQREPAQMSLYASFRGAYN
jgi:hypothetical protein